MNAVDGTYTTTNNMFDVMRDLTRDGVDPVQAVVPPHILQNMRNWQQLEITPSRYLLKMWKQGVRLHSPQFTKRQHLLLDLQELLLFGIIGCGIIGMKLR